ncbi:MAG TPA: pilus assembly protein [Armatimonadetes bacterium]|jgi:Flp pilus assembly protein TadG|nr:pilus assembly protein [Armatimonadota bacterium]
MQHDHAAAVRRRRSERGAALVECALVVPFLALLVLGTAEIGRLTRSQLALAQAAREGAQSAARGYSIERCVARVLNVAEQGGLIRDNVHTIALEYSSGGGYWETLVDSPSGTDNASRRGNLVRVRVRYRHPLISRMVFPGSQREMSHVMVARRQ